MLRMMSGIFLIDGIRAWFRRRDRDRRVRLAQGRPCATGEINHWSIQPVNLDEGALSSAWQIEAGFHFVLNGEYFGGYLHSTAMGRSEAEAKAKGSPLLRVRYNPANPDEVVVLAEDNRELLPFPVVSG